MVPILIWDLGVRVPCLLARGTERQNSHHGSIHMASTAVANTPAAISTRAARLAIAAIAGSTHRDDLSQTGPRSFLAHDERMGHRASRLDYVRGVSYLGTELCGLAPDAEVAATWNSWPYRTRNTLDLCDWRGWRGNIYDRSYAASLPAIHQGHTSRDIRHQSVGAPSICSAAFQPQPGLQQ